ncbi:unnamed protein product [Rhizoctonia solani]|uniref:Uncharacterized protein n=1 Tax=Rhizoctonia solani TaxID=456999 RepID=A0A8H3H9F5_9AGAM|nr:unnamed protein product [Rhizoctonia solani]
MPVSLVSAIPPLAPFLLFVDDILYGGYRNRRREKEAFVLHLRRVIALLESASTSADDVGSDAQWILNFQTRLAGILEDLDPGHRSIVRRVRARLMCDEHFIQEISREIDTVLRLVELRAVVSLNGGVISLRGGMDHLLSVSNNSLFRTLPDTQVGGSAFSAHNGACRCAESQVTSKGSDTVQGQSALDTTAQSEPNFDQILDAAYQNVVHHRRLADQDHSHRPCLVKSLNLLVQLLRRIGRISDALQYSLEANRLLGMMAQGTSQPHKS